MRTVRKSIDLAEDKPNQRIEAHLNADHYSRDSIDTCDLICREQAHTAKIGIIRAALVEGESSGDPKPFDVVAFKQRMLTTYG